MFIGFSSIPAKSSTVIYLGPGPLFVGPYIKLAQFDWNLEHMVVILLTTDVGIFKAIQDDIMDDMVSLVDQSTTGALSG